MPPNSTLLYTIECVTIDKGPMPTAPSGWIKGLPLVAVIVVVAGALFFLTPVGHAYLVAAETHVKAIVMWVLLLATPGCVCLWWAQMVMERRRLWRQLKER